MAAIAETANFPAACAGPEKRMGALSPLECSGSQEVIKNVIGRESAGSDQPVLQALGRRMPAILHACFT
jgi:hypothetical protein